MPFSPRSEYDGESVLLTGALGFLGSVVLEKLLRCTNVKTVYLLVRSKRNKSAEQRVEEMLCSPLFNMLHDEAIKGKRNVFSKVQAVQGDLSFPELGLSPGAMKLLQSEVGIVIHCAANIELDAEIQWTLKHNYCGTRELMRVSGSFDKLRAFLHTSTYFVNNHLPRNTVVPEKIHPLPLAISGKPVSHAEYVEEMLGLDAAEADKQTLELMGRLNFNSTYAFGKHLTERLVNETQVKPGVAKVIVRPSLISGVAADPYPGFVTGYGGPSGYTMGYAVGFFQGISSVAYRSDYMMDLIPADTVAAVVLAGAARAASQHDSAAAAGATQEATIYHAASAQSHPLLLAFVFETADKFWTKNQPPLVLPATKYVTFQGKYAPTSFGIEFGRLISVFKIWLLGLALKLVGKSREARILANAFKAFSVYNSPRYDRSIISDVTNVRKLVDEVECSERSMWPCIWLPSSMHWAVYGNTFFAAIRRLLFRMEAESTSNPPHLFKFRSGVAASVLSMQPTAASNGSAASEQQAASAPAVIKASPGKDQRGKAAVGKAVSVSATAGTKVNGLAEVSPVAVCQTA